MIAAEDINAIEAGLRTLSVFKRSDIHIRTFKPLAGGSINNVFRVETSQGPFALKYSTKPLGATLFASEANQLAVLHRKSTFKIPKVLLNGSGVYGHFLVLEYLERGSMLPQFWESFGHKLAIMHRNTHTAFGGVPSNYLGTLAQPNPDTPTWQDFFAAWRLLPTARLALNKGLLNASEFAQVERACIRIAEICPNEPPSLVHGDLWKGNYLIGPEGQPCLIDPALHYGHREAELAMTLLFGGFDSQFYAAYQNEWPLVKGFQSRFQFYNLYPLLVHLVLFGSGYHFAVRSILDEFGS